ncbi:MAG: DUF4492 domain-containing protein [Bacteroidales bacterium]
MSNIFYKVWHFYTDGFKNMTVGRTLWTIILIKLLVLFLILKLFFFPDILKREYPLVKDRGEHVLEHLIKFNK